MTPFEKLWKALEEAYIVVHPSENPEWTERAQKLVQKRMRKQGIVVTDLDLPDVGTSSGRVAPSAQQERS